jgi:hypothetical protein
MVGSSLRARTLSHSPSCPVLVSGIPPPQPLSPHLGFSFREISAIFIQTHTLRMWKMSVCKFLLLIAFAVGSLPFLNQRETCAAKPPNDPAPDSRKTSYTSMCGRSLYCRH